jgi:hypothetical protein
MIPPKYRSVAVSTFYLQVRTVQVLKTDGPPASAAVPSSLRSKILPMATVLGRPFLSKVSPEIPR